LGGANQIVAAFVASPQTPLLAAEGLCEEPHLENAIFVAKIWNTPLVGEIDILFYSGYRKIIGTYKINAKW